MDVLSSEFDDIVIFELPAFEDVEEFCDRFRPEWPGWSHTDAGVWLFAVDFRGQRENLPRLLRGAQELVAEVGLAAIRFYLDGRIYVLEAAPRRAKARADQSSVSDGPIASLGSED